VIYSKEDLVLNGKGSLTVTSAKGNGITSKDDLKITGGTLKVTAQLDALEANDSILISDGDITVTGSEGIEGTYVQINGGEITVTGTDDGINGANKSSAYETAIEIAGGTLNVTVGQGDTDAIDSNGNLYVSGGTINITSTMSSFDYDGTATCTGGTIIVNGQTVNSITSSMMGGGMGGFGGRR